MQSFVFVGHHPMIALLSLSDGLRLYYKCILFRWHTYVHVFKVIAGCLKKSYKSYQTDLVFSGVIIALQSLLIACLIWVIGKLSLSCPVTAKVARLRSTIAVARAKFSVN